VNNKKDNNLSTKFQRAPKKFLISFVYKRN